MEDTKSNQGPSRTKEIDVAYSITDRSFLDLSLGEAYTVTVDFAQFINYDLDRGATYRVWLEYDAWGKDHMFKDSTSHAPVWPSKMVSDTLEFVF